MTPTGSAPGGRAGRGPNKSVRAQLGRIELALRRMGEQHDTLLWPQWSLINEVLLEYRDMLKGTNDANNPQGRRERAAGTPQDDLGPE